MQNTPTTQPNRIFTTLIIVLIGVAAMLAAYIGGIPFGADLDNHFRFAQPFYDEIASGNLFPGWLAESNNGFGDARFRFYPPLLYYMLAAGRFLTGDWYAATLGVFTLFSVVGCGGVYLWTRENFTRNTAIAAAFVFALLPYHLAQFYQASLLAEFAAISFLPFAFLFVERISRGGKLIAINIAGLGVSFSLIVLTHIPTTIVSSLGLGLFALLCTDWKHRKRSLIFAAAGICLGMLLSSFFWIKVLTELSWIQSAQMATAEHYDYRKNFLFSPYSLTSLNTYLGSMIAAVTIGVFLPAMTLLPRIFSKGKKLDGLKIADKSVKSLRAAVIVAAFAFLMTTDLSRPLWAIIPKMSDIQFPFRWLSVVSVAVCPAAALAFVWFAKKIAAKQIRPWQLAVFAVAISSLGYSFWEFAVSSDFLNRQTFTERIEASRAAPSFTGWLPFGASEIKDVKPMTGPIDPNGREVISSQITTHHRRFTLAAGPATDIRIRTYYYPHWQATIVGVGPAQTKKAEDGTLLVSIPAESCEVSVDFIVP